MMKMFILTTTLPLLPHDSCQQLANSFSHPCHSSLWHRISQYRFPYGLYFWQPTHAILFPYKRPPKVWKLYLPHHISVAIWLWCPPKCHQSAPSTSFTIHTLATCFSPISCDLSSGSDIGFHTTELLLTFDSWFSFLLNCNLNTYFPWLYPHSIWCIIWFHVIFFSHYDTFNITLCEPFISTIMPFCSTRSSP